MWSYYLYFCEHSSFYVFADKLVSQKVDWWCLWRFSCLVMVFNYLLKCCMSKLGHDDISIIVNRAASDVVISANLFTSKTNQEWEAPKGQMASSILSHFVRKAGQVWLEINKIHISLSKVYVPSSNVLWNISHYIALSDKDTPNSQFWQMKETIWYTLVAWSARHFLLI